MPDDMVTVATFTNTVEAEMARNELEAAGIRAFLMGDNSANIFGGMTALFGAIPLVVASGNQLRALAILDRLAEDDEVNDEEPEEPESEASTAIKAPQWKRNAAVAARDADPSIQAVPPVEQIQEGMPPDTAEPADDEDDRPSLETDDNANPTWRVAVIGLLIFVLGMVLLSLLRF